MSKPQAAPAGATFAVAVLTSINLLNYVDRYVPSPVKKLFKDDLHLTDAQTSYPITAFLLVYLVASPIFSSLADRFPRRFLIAIGVALWSIATAAAAFATGFLSLLIPRALVGIGEAAYATLSPALLSDYFPPERRNRVLTLFNVAVPVGGAIGFVVGGYVGQHYGWRDAFLVCGLPGLLAAGLVLFVREPPRGAFDAPQSAPAAWPDALREMSRSRVYILTVAGYTAVTFGSGALADWFPTFLIRYRGYDVESAATVCGGAAALGGFLGTAAGGIAGDWLRGKTRQAYLALSGWSMAISTVLIVLAIHVSSHLAMAFVLFAGQFFMWCYNGPVNAIVVNAVSAGMRARAVAMAILCVHLFGDAISPSIVGMRSDATGSLESAIALVPLSLVACTIIWLYGWRTAPEIAPAVNNDTGL